MNRNTNLKAVEDGTSSSNLLWNLALEAFPCPLYGHQDGIQLWISSLVPHGNATFQCFLTLYLTQVSFRLKDSATNWKEVCAMFAFRHREKSVREATLAIVKLTYSFALNVFLFYLYTL